eukprot:TRINITY_DN88_c2_g1_i1.p1 TRINITY_DN88_c2_g1~~TRINITY_DN88_c2_g1_i1.p1  ORF type:complete len:145 (+),score=69.67 TRINITY_DN88_c2_g1_i1:170-604(+)
MDTNKLRLRDVLANVDLTVALRCFMQKNINSELLSFYLRAHDFKSLVDPEDIRIKGLSIFHQFFTQNAPNEISITAEEREKINRKLQIPNEMITAFDESRQLIEKQIEIECLPQFFASDNYKIVQQQIKQQQQEEKKNNKKKFF